MADNIQNQIKEGRGIIGLEMGSTRIKAVLIDEDNKPVASGGFGWDNVLEKGVWTYSLDKVWEGVEKCFADLAADVREKYGLTLFKVKAIGISGMMHGYLVFDREGKQLVPFRTWRNNITEKASEELTKLFNYPIPQRWSIAHLYQSVLNGEEHVKSIGYITTLAGYVHWKLTGQKVVGVGEASGMFPVDPASKEFNLTFIEKFDNLVGSKGYSWKLKDILPEVLTAGENGGSLTSEGALMLDPSGTLKHGVPLCPPEGDAGTGMAATNSVSIRTGNISAGTSVFAMLVLEKELSRVHPEIDFVTTPDGSLVGMVHSNNCTSDYDAWISLFGQALSHFGKKVETSQLYDTLLGLALKGDADCGGLMSYGYLSGEHITGFEEGRPLFVRSPDSNFTLENFIRTHLFTSLCALRAGLDILLKDEGIQVNEVMGHGGFFKTREVGQRIMAAAINAPVSVLETAGEGGAWGIALLAAYMVQKQKGESLADFLKGVFSGSMGKSVSPDRKDVEGFEAFYERYRSGLAVERAAVDNL